MKILIFLCATVLVSAEKPGPYSYLPPQGARLELPPSRAYGKPLDARNVEFTTLTNEYNIPQTTQSPRSNKNNDEFLNVQGLPAVNANSQYQNFQQQKQQQQKLRRPLNAQKTAKIVMAPAPAFGGNQPLLLSPLFAPQFAAPNQQLREQKFTQVQQNPKNDVQQLLPQQQQQYGPPEITTEYPQNDSEEETDENDDDEEEEEDQQPVIAVANANAETQAKLFAATQQGQFGQYYVLLPDSSLQKVRFATGQSDDDRQANGFSAQLKYSPVEPIKDPVYGYDEQGKLVRLF